MHILHSHTVSYDPVISHWSHGMKQSRAWIDARVKSRSDTLAARRPEAIWAKVDKRGPDECWNWLGKLGKTGYGRTEIRGVRYQVHRVIFNFLNPGVIELRAPKNRRGSGYLLHSCDNPACCNPAHLRV